MQYKLTRRDHNSTPSKERHQRQKQRRMSKVKILVVGGTGYLGQHLLQAYVHANANNGTPFAFDLAFTHHSSPPPQPLLDAIPFSLPFQVDLKTGFGFEAISNTFGQVLFSPSSLEFGCVDYVSSFSIG